MAKGDKKITKTFNWEDYSKGKHKKWNNKKEYDTISEVRTRFSGDMAAARRTSCPWAQPFVESAVLTDENDETVEEGQSTGTDWADRWNMDDKLEMMWHDYDETRSNLKSPTTFGPVQAALAEFQENNVGVTFTATEYEDEAKAKLNKYLHEYWENKSNIAVAKKTTFFETLVRGTSLPYNGWQLKKRKVDIILSSKATRKELKKMQDERSEEIEAAKDTIMKEMRPLTKREEITEYNDCVYVPTSLFEMYVDPDARVLRGPAYEAIDMAWRQIPSLEQFRAEFKNSTDPWVKKKNIDFVRGATEAQEVYEGANPFFEAPEDISGAKVELLRYYNKQTDKYIIIANDILIREGPLPYNHKELPFSRHIYYEMKDQFYGAGLAVMLESLQSEDETLRNMLLDQLKLEINRPLFINTNVFNDVDLGWEYVEPGLKVEVGGEVGSNNINWMPPSGANMEAYRMRSDIREDEIRTTGINPMSYSTPQQGEAVRTHLLTMESTLKMIKKGIRNWTEGDGWANSVRQFVRIRQQMLPESYITEVDKDNKVKKKENRTVRTEGVQLHYENGELFEESLDGGYGYFKMEDEYLDLVGDIDIQVDVDTLVPRSYGLKVEQVKEAMGILPNLLSNEQVMAAPGMLPLTRNYIDIVGLDKRIKEQFKDQSTEEEMLEAEEQNKLILSGEKIDGIPGESDSHIKIHQDLLIELTSKRDELKDVDFEDDPYGILGDIVESNQSELSKIEEKIANLSSHLMVDTSSKSEAPQLALQAAQPPAPPESTAPEMGGMPGMDMGGMGPMGGMPGGGMPPEAMMPEGMPPGAAPVM